MSNYPSVNANSTVSNKTLVLLNLIWVLPLAVSIWGFWITALLSICFTALAITFSFKTAIKLTWYGFLSFGIFACYLLSEQFAQTNSVIGSTYAVLLLMLSMLMIVFIGYDLIVKVFTR